MDGTRSCGSPKVNRPAFEGVTSACSLVRVADQWFIREVNQHGMVLIVEPAAKDIETPVWRPGRSIRVPTPQLLLEDLLAQLAENVGDLLVRVALGNEVDGWVAPQIEQCNVPAGRVGRLQPIQNGLFWGYHDGGPVQRGHFCSSSLTQLVVRNDGATRPVAGSQ